MSFVPLEIKGYPYRNVDETTSSKAPFVLYDGYCDEALADHLRPGHSLFVDLGTSAPIQGQHYWSEQDLVVAASNGRIFTVNSIGTITEITGDALTNLSQTTFASYGTGFFMASGDKMIRYTGAGLTAYVADPDAPTSVSHVAYLDGYIIANLVNSQQAYYSDPVDTSVWTAVFFSAEGKPDKVKALFVKENTIFIFGRDTVEFWYNDGVTPFSRYAGSSGVLEEGCIAPYSIVWSDAFSWMNTKRQIIVLQGRQSQIISDPIQLDLDALTTPDDCISFQIKINGNPFLVFSFLTDQKTFVFDVKQKGWAEWSKYNTVTGLREHFFGINSCLAVTFEGKQLIGSRFTSEIYTQNANSYLDGTDTIKWEKISGEIDFGTINKKNYKSMIFKMKRGSVVADPAPVFSYAFRDDGNKTWSNEYQIDLGKTGEYYSFAQLFRLGQSRTRQHRLYHTDNSPFVLTDIQIDVETLKS